jgi:hypothetical protein
MAAVVLPAAGLAVAGLAVAGLTVAGRHDRDLAQGVT